jgi:deoxyhypusine synthase
MYVALFINFWRLGESQNKLMNTIDKANQVNQQNALEQAEQTKQDYQAERLKRAFKIVLEIFPDANRERALIIAGAMVQHFDEYKKKHFH